MSSSVSCLYRNTYRSAICSTLSRTHSFSPTLRLIIVRQRDGVNQSWEACTTWKARHCGSNCICVCTVGRLWRSHMKRGHYSEAFFFFLLSILWFIRANIWKVVAVTQQSWMRRRWMCREAVQNGEEKHWHELFEEEAHVQEEDAESEMKEVCILNSRAQGKNFELVFSRVFITSYFHAQTWRINCWGKWINDSFRMSLFGIFFFCACWIRAGNTFCSYLRGKNMKRLRDKKNLWIF